MAEGRVYVCNHCGFAVEAWSDGNPYYIDDSGKKCYAHHPNHAALERCIGNDIPIICLFCATQGVSDSRAPADRCEHCESPGIVPTWRLQGELCPKCDAGTFEQDPRQFRIS